MKVYAALLVLAYVAYCQAADKNYGEYCTKDDKCLGSTECPIASGCTYGVCRCGNGKTRDSGNNCKSVMKYGEACSTSSDCYTGYCSDKKCACTTGNVASDDKKTCGKFVTMECTANSDCGSNMECKDKKCACLSGYTENDKMCYGYKLGEDCTDPKKCMYGTCTDKKCSCSNSLVAYIEKYCIHKDATTNIGKGSECNSDYAASTGKLCKDGFYCNTCPNASNKVCMSGATSIKAGVLTAVLAAVMALLRL